MPRPKKCRYIQCKPNAYYFKPRGIPLTELLEISLTVDELEAIRLADFQGLYHDDAATQMRVSRPTFGRILAQGRKKVAEALIQGKALRIESFTNSDFLQISEEKEDRGQEAVDEGPGKEDQ
jgi:predicted DNA-binding protein (UPF0251 family)